MDRSRGFTVCILFNFLEWNMDFFMVYPKSNNAFFSSEKKGLDLSVHSNIVREINTYVS